MNQTTDGSTIPDILDIPDIHIPNIYAARHAPTSVNSDGTSVTVFNNDRDYDTDDGSTFDLFDRMINVIENSTTSSNVVVQHTPAPLRKLTAVQETAGNTIAKWWRVIVPCITWLRVCRKSEFEWVRV